MCIESCWQRKSQVTHISHAIYIACERSVCVSIHMRTKHVYRELAAHREDHRSHIYRMLHCHTYSVYVLYFTGTNVQILSCAQRRRRVTHIQHAIRKHAVLSHIYRMRCYICVRAHVYRHTYIACAAIHRCCHTATHLSSY